MMRGAADSVRARTTGLTAADVDRALTEERSLLITGLIHCEGPPTAADLTK